MSPADEAAIFQQARTALARVTPGHGEPMPTDPPPSPPPPPKTATLGPLLLTALTLAAGFAAGWAARPSPVVVTQSVGSGSAPAPSPGPSPAPVPAPTPDPQPTPVYSPADVAKLQETARNLITNVAHLMSAQDELSKRLDALDGIPQRVAAISDVQAGAATERAAQSARIDDLSRTVQQVQAIASALATAPAPASAATPAFRRAEPTPQPQAPALQPAQTPNLFVAPQPFLYYWMPPQ